MKTPLVSIIMPVFNNTKFLKFAIKSIINQTYKNFEFIIINDGSEEDIEEIISGFNDSRIVYKKTKHRGIAGALNYGIEIAASDLIARMDADDLALPERISLQLDFSIKNPAYDVISCRYAVFHEKRISYIVEIPEFDDEIKKALMLHNVICHPGVLIKKEILKIFGGYRNVKLEDYDLWLRIMEQANFYNIINPLMLLRYNKNSLTRRNIHQTNLQVNYLHKIYFPQSSKEMENSEILGWREYFYGNKELSRNYWKRDKKNLFRSVRLLIAFILTYFPLNLFTKLKEERLKFRYNYIFKTDPAIKNKLKNNLQILSS